MTDPLIARAAELYREYETERAALSWWRRAMLAARSHMGYAVWRLKGGK